MITAVVTVHRVLHKLASTLASLAKLPNISQIVVTATGMDKATLLKLRKLAKGCVIVENPSDYSNEAWLNGVKHASNSLTVLLHDGDVLAEEFGTVLFKAGYINIYQGYNITGPRWIHNELCVNNYPSNTTDFLRLLSNDNTKVISPGRGVFPTSILIEALVKFQGIDSPSLWVNTLAIGNDWLIWHTAVNSIYPIHSIPMPLVGFDVEDSTTVRADSGASRLEKFYNETRRRVGVSATTTVLTTCYVPNASGPRLSWSQAMDYNIIPFQLLNFPVSKNHSAKNAFGTAAFMTALEIAYCNGYEYLLYVEDDCRLQPRFADAMVEEFLNELEGSLYDKPILYGTPIVWNPMSPGRYFYQRFLTAAESYYRFNSIPLQIQGDRSHQPAVYANGALAIYDVKFFFWLLMTAKTNIESLIPWDLIIGYRLYDLYRENVFNKIIPSSVSYSDGDLNFLPLAARTSTNILAWHK
jgi:hypothetical protein